MSNSSFQASIRRSGGVEGSVERLTLPESGGGFLTFFYQHYSIPDRFIIRYEGQVIVDTGFVPGEQNKRIRLPDGNASFVDIVMATNDPGTAWDYTVSYEGGCNVPDPYFFDRGSGSVAHNSATGFCVFTGSSARFGRADGNAAFVIAGGATSFNDRILRVVDGTITAGLGLTSAPLFAGTFDFDFRTGRAAVTETRALANDWDIAGLDLTYQSLRFVQSGTILEAEATFRLPTVLGGTLVELSRAKGTALQFSPGGVDMVGAVQLAPNLRFGVGDSASPVFQLSMDEVTLDYITTRDALLLQGKAEIEGLFKPLGGTTKFKLDFSGRENGVEYTRGPNGAGRLDLMGEAKLEGELDLGVLEIEELTLTLDTRAGRYTAAAKMELDFLKRFLGTELELDVGIVLKSNPSLTIDGFRLGVYDIDRRLGVKPIWLEEIAIEASNLSNLSLSQIRADAQVGLGLIARFPSESTGTKGYRGYVDAKGTIDLGDGKIVGTADFTLNNLTGSGTPLVTAKGNITLDWTQPQFTMSASVDVLGGLFRGSGLLNVNAQGFSLQVDGSLNIPKGIWEALSLGFWATSDYTLASARLSGSYTMDGNDTNDFVGVAGTFFGLNGGVRINLNTGAVNFVGHEDLALPASTGRSTSPAGQFVVTAGTPSIVLVADWSGIATANVPLRLTRPDGVVINEAGFAAAGVTVLNELSGSSHKSVSVANPMAGTWTIAVVNPAGLGTVAYDAFGARVAPALDIRSITTNGNDDATVAINPAGLPSGTTLQLFFDTDATGFDGLPATGRLAVSSLATNTAGQRLITWDTTEVPTGTYRVYAVLEDGVGAPVRAYAPSPVVIDDVADLAVTMTPRIRQLIPGGQVVFDVAVTNTGNAPAVDSFLQLTAPSGYQEAGRTGFSLTSAQPGTLATYNLGTVQPGQTVAGTVTLSVPSNPSFLNASLSAATRTHEADADDNQASSLLFTTRPMGPDLAVAARLITAPQDLDDAYAYEVTVTNRGTGPATGIRVSAVTDDAPNAVTGPQGTSQITPASSSPVASYSMSLASLAGGQTATWSVTGVPNSLGDLYAQLEVSADALDPDLTNNAATITVPVTAAPPPPVDVSLTLTNTVSATGRGTATVTVTNTGAAVAEQLVVRLSTKPGFDVTSNSPAQGSFDPLTGLWTVGNINNGISRTLQLSLDWTGTPTLTAELVSMNTRDIDSTPGNGVTTEDDFARVTMPAGLINAAPTAFTAPTALTLSESHAPGSVLGTLTLTDADAAARGDRAVFRISNDPSGLFTVQGNEVRLRSDRALDFETATSHVIGLRAEDRFGIGFDSNFTITVTNVPGVTWTGTSGPDTAGAGVATAEDDVLRGLGGNDNLSGLQDRDVLDGGPGNDTLTGGAGNDRLDGGPGVDTAIFSGNRAQYTITWAGGAYTVTGPDGTDTLINVDRMRFADGSQWMQDAASQTGVVHRFFNSQTGVHFTTASNAEANWIRETFAQFDHEGLAFRTAPDSATGTADVFRFFNVRTQSHFFTSSAAERDQIIATLPQFQFEGTAYKAYGADRGPQEELYRFYNVQTQAHFFTVSEEERDYVRGTFPQFTYEGIAFFVDVI